MKSCSLVGFCLLILLSIVPSSRGQVIKLQEGFEGTDSIPPLGWGAYNNAPFYTEPENLWVVRDTGRSLPGLSTARSRSHSGAKAAGVSWLAGTDTLGGFLQSDAWLITKRISAVKTGDMLKFWATGGTASYLDSLQIWMLGTDSLPSVFEYHMASIIWPTGSVYGQFEEYSYDISIANGLDIWIGFRYFQDVAIDGFFVHVDDVSVEGLSGVDQISGAVPEKFGLVQNYPNPFNPTTTIEFSVPVSNLVMVKVYDAMGREVTTLVNETLSPGTYKTRWNAQGFSSGTYFYRLIAGTHVETQKLMLVK